MKLGPVTKVDKRKKKTKKKKKNYYEVMPENCYVIAIFPICSQFGAIRKPDSERKCRCYTLYMILLDFIDFH